MKNYSSLFIFVVFFLLVTGCKKKSETCSDGILNQNETAVDCGGPCKPCPTCSDGILNQNETDVDCGGVCPACQTCSDGIQNQGETGIDCGGPCQACINPATQNTNFIIGGSGWSCGIQSSTFTATYNSSQVKFIFNSNAPQNGQYTMASTAAPGACAVTLLNAPDQPAGILWFGKSGTVTVSFSNSAFYVSFLNAVFTQKNFNFPAVTASAALACQ